MHRVVLRMNDVSFNWLSFWDMLRHGFEAWLHHLTVSFIHTRCTRTQIHLVLWRLQAWKAKKQRRKTISAMHNPSEISLILLIYRPHTSLYPCLVLLNYTTKFLESIPLLYVGATSIEILRPNRNALRQREESLVADIIMQGRCHGCYMCAR